MWTGDTAWKQPAKIPLYFQRLREMGVNATMVHGDGNLQPLLENHFPYYVENMVNKGLCLKFNSNVKDWDKFVTTWTKEGRPESALTRDYGLDDPQWRSWARQQMQSLVRKNQAHAPLAYDIRDELSTTLSANPFDYDFGPTTLAHFRTWLKTQYPDLNALNAEWETHFLTWDEVKPFTTDQIKNRLSSGDAIPRGQPDWQAVQRTRFNPTTARQSPTRWNFSPWADFRTYMDISLADTLNDIRHAAHELDPLTPVGIEGTQAPSAFGGYDLWRLSQALDWVEPYDISCAREIFGSFMPGQPFLTTVGESNANAARRRLWHLLLLGDHGCIVWWSEDCIDWKNDTYPLTAKGQSLSGALKEMTSPLAQLFFHAEHETDPVFIHYSQASIQVDWLLESCVDGSTWLRRFSSYESAHNRQLQVRNSWLKAMQDLGFSPQFVSTAQIESGVLKAHPNAALILPDSLALSENEANAIQSFLASSTTDTHSVLCDGSPGLFNEHGRLRKASPLETLFPAALSIEKSYAVLNHGQSIPPQTNDIANYGRLRAQADFPADWLTWMTAATRQIPRPVSVPLNARVRIHRYRLGTERLLAFERNISYQMGEDLKQAGGNENLEKPFQTEARLDHPAHVYDLRSGKYLGLIDTIPLQIDPWQPSLFALLSKKMPAADVLRYLTQMRR